MSKEKNWEYETKCRRCGTLIDWLFSSVEMTERINFMKAMVSYIQNPRAYKCQKCKKKTVQDLVSYTD